MSAVEQMYQEREKDLGSTNKERIADKADCTPRVGWLFYSYASFLSRSTSDIARA